MTRLDLQLRCISFVLQHEGGYVNHKSDPGGETNFGISKRAHPEVDIKNLTREEASDIYAASYWKPLTYRTQDRIPPATLLQLFDLSVNGGLRRATQILQQACGTKVDGTFGPQTRSVAAGMESKQLAHRYFDSRCSFYRSLDTFEQFGKGWIRRATEALIDGLKMEDDD